MRSPYLLSALAEARIADLHRAAAQRRATQEPRSRRVGRDRIRVAVSAIGKGIARVAGEPPRDVADPH